MGKRHFKGNNATLDKKRRKDNAEKWKNTRGDENPSSWMTVTENKRMEAFYKAQHFVQEGTDWDNFLTSLRTTLPATFRIYSDYPFSAELKTEITSFMDTININLDGIEMKSLEQLPWYPEGNAYKLGVDRRSIRKMESLNPLHKWMIQHSDNGSITRQEAVSMVPPLALDVLPHHKCLDMCASPGSKTSQLLEIVNKSLSSTEQGLVVANDVDTDRAYMLVHQCKRINSPLLVITTHPGQAFPFIGTGSAGQHKGEFFDRVLCDVPCSGDGTLRKNPMIWGKWCTAMAMGLHGLQVSIAKRGLQVLKAGGIMVYSTCSLSPYEDEAVVAELLRAHKGQLELVDARQYVRFTAREGLSSWYVLDDYHAVKRENREKRAQKKATAVKEEGKEVKDEGSAEQQDMEVAEGAEDAAEEEDAEAQAEQAEAAASSKAVDSSTITDPLLRACVDMGMTYYPTPEDVPEHLDYKLKRSFFPPTPEEAEWMQLSRCLRCAPQDEDSGGFFVAALRKIAHKEEVAAVPMADVVTQSLDAEVPPAACASAGAAVPASKGKNVSSKGLVTYHPWEASAFDKAQEFYQMDGTLTRENFYIREDMVNKTSKGTESKTIYYVPTAMRDCFAADSTLKIVTAGVKAFEKKVYNNQTDYRLVQDAVHILSPHMAARRVSVNAQDMSNILGGGLVSFITLSASTLQQLHAQNSGMVICTYTYSPADVVDAVPREPSDALVFRVVCWKGFSKTMNVMCSKIDIDQMKHQMAALGVLR